ncbi:MAG: PDZ domain-containing protein [Terriglobales bacterium]
MRKWMTVKSLILPVLAMAMIAGRSDVLFASEEASGFPADGGESTESYLGVDTRDITPDRLAPLQLKDEKGVEVTMVDQDAPAGKAGLKDHDVILGVNGTEVESVEQLRRLIHEIPAGRTVSISLSRNGQPMTVKADLAARKKGVVMSWPQGNNFRVNIPPMPPIPSMPDMDVPVSIVIVHSSTRSGLMVENLTPQLGDFFGVKNGEGILVRSVEKGSRAEAAGFHAGDVIVRVNQEKIGDSGDFTHALNFRKGNSASVTVLRDRKQLSLTLTLPDHGPTGQGPHESTNWPIGDARTRMDIVRAESELAHLQPEIQCQLARHAAELQRMQNELELRTADMKRIQPEIERATRAAREELKTHMNELELQMDQRNDLIRKWLQHAFPNQADI